MQLPTGWAGLWPTRYGLHSIKVFYVSRSGDHAEDAKLRCFIAVFSQQKPPTFALWWVLSEACVNVAASVSRSGTPPRALLLEVESR